MKKNILSSILFKIENNLANKWLNILYTIYINFRCLPLKQAVKFPIYIYGFPRFYSLLGEIICKGEIKSGMIKINVTKYNYGSPENSSQNTEICNFGKIIFNGPIYIGCGCKIVVSQDGILNLGPEIRCNNNSKISCFHKISIGRNTRLAHGVQIMDTNFHYSANLEKHIVYNYKGEINIGENCWLTNGCSIMKDSILPNNTIVASHSLVNKDFSSIKPGTLIGGIPAKPISENIYRIWNSELEKDIIDYFKNNPNKKIYQLPDWVNSNNI